MKNIRLRVHMRCKLKPPIRPPKSHWGNVYWDFLHTMAYHYPSTPNPRQKVGYEQFIYTFINVIPCMKCQSHYYEYVSQNPPIGFLHSRIDFMFWVWELHNHINKIAYVNNPIKSPCFLRVYRNHKKRFGRIY